MEEEPCETEARVPCACSRGTFLRGISDEGSGGRFRPMASRPCLSCMLAPCWAPLLASVGRDDTSVLVGPPL